MNQAVDPRDKGLVYLRHWVGKEVIAHTEKEEFSGKLTNIAFDDKRSLIYIMIDDSLCLNFNHVVALMQSK